MTPPTLTRRKIADEALALAEEGGPTHVTMRRLAARLGVTPTALYHHYAGRDELLDAMVDRLCAPIVEDLSADGDGWAATLRRALTRWMARAEAQPTLTGWAVTTHARSLAVLRIHEALVAVLLDAGFTPDAALHVKGAVMRFWLGHLAVDELAPGTDWRAGLPDDELPRYRSIAHAVDAFDRQRQFEIGLDALLAGLAASPLAPRPAADDRHG
jgi:AcrR family transcriptional regulator